MEKIKARIMLIGLLLLLGGCAEFGYTDPVVDSLPCQTSGRLDTCGVFQDYTDYGVYTYSEITADILERNPYFRQVTEADIPTLQRYLENFEGWVAHAEDCDDCSLAENYDFSPDRFQPGNYFYLKNKSASNYRPYDNYDLYYFSLEDQTLYFFHNNI